MHISIHSYDCFFFSILTMFITCEHHCSKTRINLQYILVFNKPNVGRNYHVLTVLPRLLNVHYLVVELKINFET